VNTTAHLIDDVLRLRRELNIHRKMHVFGGSWGSTLALAYAIAHPETVQTLILRGVFLCPRADVDFFLSEQRRFRAGSARDAGARRLSGFPGSLEAFRHGNPARRPR
jgi:pimeloyl-ACP methyl ester carboxylesterase